METTSAPVIRLDNHAWYAWMRRVGLGVIQEQADYVGVSRSQLYRVIGGDTPGEQFIAACLAKYDGTFEGLFEIAEAS